MTTPVERTRAVQEARDFLFRLINREQTPRVPKHLREEAQRILRHFPTDWDLQIAAKNEYTLKNEYLTWGPPD